jgi:hypothetical protein
MKKFKIGKYGFEHQAYNNIENVEILKGDIIEIIRFDTMLDGKKHQDLVVKIRDYHDHDIELILKYTSREARQIMNIMAKLNYLGIKECRNMKLFFLSDKKEGTAMVNLRLEKDGEHITWLYENLPEIEVKEDGTFDYNSRDKFWDDIFPSIKGVW